MKKKIGYILIIFLLALASILAPAKTYAAENEEVAVERKSSRVAGDSISNPKSISLGTIYSGSVKTSDKATFYKYTLSSSGRVNLKATAGMNWINYRIYDSNGEQLWYKNPAWNSTTKEISTDEIIDLTKGTYYFVVERDGNHTGNYSFKLSYTSANESFKEYEEKKNNSIAEANSIASRTSYTGQIAVNDANDFYKFQTKTSGDVVLTATAKTKYIYYRIYDANGKQLWYKNSCWNSTTGKSDISEMILLTKGTYYFVVERDGNCTGNYSFKITTPAYYPKNIKLSCTSYTYNGEARKPSVIIKTSSGSKVSTSNYSVTYASGRKNVGKYKVTIKFKGKYDGIVTKYFTIKPKATSISGLTRASKAFTVKWKKQATQTTGYEIRYSRSSKFSSYATKRVAAKNISTKISGLKAKTKYYVKIRTYKTVNGERIYSNWSTTKTVITK